MYLHPRVANRISTMEGLDRSSPSPGPEAAQIKKKELEQDKVSQKEQLDGSAECKVIVLPFAR